MSHTDLNFEPQKIKQICNEYHIGRLALFGSYLHGKATENSDVDLLVRFNRPSGLFTLLQAKDALSDLFGKEVDLVTEGFLSPYIKENILSDLQIIYEA